MLDLSLPLSKPKVYLQCPIVLGDFFRHYKTVKTRVPLLTQEDLRNEMFAYDRFLYVLYSAEHQDGSPLIWNERPVFCDPPQTSIRFDIWNFDYKKAKRYNGEITVKFIVPYNPPRRAFQRNQDFVFIDKDNLLRYYDHRFYREVLENSEVVRDKEGHPIVPKICEVYKAMLPKKRK